MFSWTYRTNSAIAMKLAGCLARVPEICNPERSDIHLLSDRAWVCPTNTRAFSSSQMQSVLPRKSRGNPSFAQAETQLAHMLKIAKTSPLKRAGHAASCAYLRNQPLLLQRGSIAATFAEFYIEPLLLLLVRNSSPPRSTHGAGPCLTTDVKQMPIQATSTS